MSEEFILDTCAVAVTGKKHGGESTGCSQRGNYISKHNSQEAVGLQRMLGLFQGH